MLCCNLGKNPVLCLQVAINNLTSHAKSPISKPLQLHDIIITRYNKKSWTTGYCKTNQWTYWNHCNGSEIVDPSEMTFRELRDNSSRGDNWYMTTAGHSSGTHRLTSVFWIFNEVLSSRLALTAPSNHGRREVAVFVKVLQLFWLYCCLVSPSTCSNI